MGKRDYQGSTTGRAEAARPRPVGRLLDGERPSAHCARHLVQWSADVIEFYLDGRSGVSPYLQLVQQVRQALRLGQLREGDQLPTVKDVVGLLAINPNTVLKAYRDLEREGLVRARPGVGTFVTRSLADATIAAHGPLRDDLRRWLDSARRAGLDDDSIDALFRSTFRACALEQSA